MVQKAACVGAAVLALGLASCGGSNSSNGGGSGNGASASASSPIQAHGGSFTKQASEICAQTKARLVVAWRSIPSGSPATAQRLAVAAKRDALRDQQLKALAGLKAPAAQQAMYGQFLTALKVRKQLSDQVRGKLGANAKSASAAAVLALERQFVTQTHQAQDLSAKLGFADCPH